MSDRGNAMAIIVHTDKPNTLLRRLQEACLYQDIPTWDIAEDDGFVHTTKSGQWKDEARIYPAGVRSGRALYFKIYGPPDEYLDESTYAYYSGRFCSMLISHFNEYFSSVTMTSSPSGRLGDRP